MRNRLIQAALAATLLSGAVAYAAGSDLLENERPAQSDFRTHERGSERIKVGGSVRGLFPGDVKWMHVRVGNRFGHAVFLRAVRVRVGNASPSCGRRNLRARRFEGRVRIVANGHVRVPVTVRMWPSATDACQNARFPLRLRARVGKR